MEEEERRIKLPIEKLLGKLFSEREYRDFRSMDNWEMIAEAMYEIPLKYRLEQSYNVLQQKGYYTYASIKNEERQKQGLKALARMENYLDEKPEAEGTDEWIVLHDMLQRMTGDVMYNEFEGT